METQMTAMEVLDEGQKRDSRGRVSWPSERREQLVEEYEKSGLSQAAFARSVGVRYPTFAHWVQERRRGTLSRPKGGEGVGRRFVEVGVAARSLSAELSVTLPGGLVARGADASALATLVRALLVQI